MPEHQVIVNILISCSIYLLIGLSFSLIFETAKFFHIAHAITITLGAYLSFWGFVQMEIPFLITLLLTILIGYLIGFAFERTIFRPLRKFDLSNWQLLIVSLGVYVILQNLVSIVWGDTARSINLSALIKSNEILGASITNIQLILVLSSCIVLLGVLIFLKISNLGRSIRAVANNSELATIHGVNMNLVLLVSLGIGSCIASFTGVLIAVDSNMIPTMGFNTFLFGIVAMIIGGLRSKLGIVGGALLLSTSQHLAAWYLDSKWMNLVAYACLIIILLWRPYGFTGERLRKVEI